jgi:hypothetical protein
MAITIESNREAIIAEFMSRLNGISVANGYPYTATNKVFRNEIESKDVDQSIQIFEQDDEVVDMLHSTRSRKSYKRELEIQAEYFLLAKVGDTPRGDNEIIAFAKAGRRALMTDSSGNFDVNLSKIGKCLGIDEVGWSSIYKLKVGDNRFLNIIALYKITYIDNTLS